MAREPLQGFYDFLGRPLRFNLRPVLFVLAALLVLSFFFPVWRISMEAPQYPKGLYMDIWLYKLQGGNGGQHITEINTLNHYIGMAHIDAVATKDLDWLPFAMGVLVLIALRVALIGNVSALLDLCVLSLYVSCFAFARFVYRLYVFGHNLSPEAPVKLQPFMPVVIGSKQVANFTIHSWPSIGSAFLGVFVLGTIVVAIAELAAGRSAYRAARAR